jgi:hypothetical protein
MAHPGHVLAICAAAAVVAVGVALQVTGPRNEADAAQPPAVVTVVAAAPLPAEQEPIPTSDPVEVGQREPVDVAAPQPIAPAVRARVLLRGRLHDTRGLAPDIDLRIRPTFPPDDENTEPIPNGVRAAPAPKVRALGQLATGITESTFSAELETVVRLNQNDDFEGTLPLVASVDGYVERDITPLFSDPQALPQALWIEVRHKNFEPRKYFVAPEFNRRAIDSAMLAREGEIVLSFDITLVPRCVARGQAWSRDGAAASIRIEAWILARGRPAGLHASAAVSSADDIFELALVPDQRYAIVALCDGLSPLTMVVYTSGALDLWLAPFVLDGGVTISGHVDLGAHLFGSESWLYLTPDGDLDPRDRFGMSGLIWTGSAFQPEVRSAQAASDGSFALDGLVPGRYRLRVGLDRDWWTEMDPVFVVSAPSSELALRPPLAHVTLQLEQEELPFARRDLRVRGAGRCSDRVSPTLTTDGLGQAAVWLLPGEPYIVEVPMGRNDWKYGKVAPWNHSEFVELVSMSSAR